jgi:hypothetical protein
MFVTGDTLPLPATVVCHNSAVAKFGEQARKRLTPLLQPGETLLAAVMIKGPIGSTGPTGETARYQKEQGLDPRDDLAYQERVTDGYLGLTESRLMLAKCPLFGSVKPKHVLIDVPLDDCEVAWYDSTVLVGTNRVVHLRLRDGRFTSFFVPLTINTLLSESDREAVVREAVALIAALRERATQDEPRGE